MLIEKFSVLPTVNTFKNVKLGLRKVKDDEIYIFKGIEIIYPENDKQDSDTIHEIELTDKQPEDIRGIDDKSTILYGKESDLIGATDTAARLKHEPKDSKIVPISPIKSNEDDFWIGVKSAGRTAAVAYVGKLYYYIKWANKGDLRDLKDQ